MTSVSIALRILARLGKDRLADMRVKFTPPYGKSANRAQLRYASAAMRSAARSAMSLS
jgi:hypothetical protein